LINYYFDRGNQELGFSMKVVVAGASGFIGRKLVQSLRSQHGVIALSRSTTGIENVDDRRCDLFSLLDAEQGMAGAEIAVYLVHSMLPSARLSQGNFQDYDLIAADNFARACQNQDVKQIIYLGGIIPEGEDLSEHLKSRLEVEQVLASYQPSLTVIRSGLILGVGGSTALMLLRLVKRLHVMLCPSWTRTPTQAIDVQDVVKLIEFSIGRKECFDSVFDVGSGAPISYRRLMAVTAEAMKVKRYFVDVPFFTPVLSHLWLTLITRAPRSLTRPIVESLKHPIVCRDHRLEKLAGLEPIPLEQSLRDTYQSSLKESVRPHAYNSLKQPQKFVRSIQRLYLPEGRDAEWVAKKYLEFLDKKFFGIFRVSVEANKATFRMWPLGIKLLEIELSESRSTPNRQLFYIKGGLLSVKGKRERLEFRVIADINVLLAGLHEYQPRLPWWLYRFTQAVVHSMVMKQFSKSLKC